MYFSTNNSAIPYIHFPFWNGHFQKTYTQIEKERGFWAVYDKMVKEEEKMNMKTFRATLRPITLSVKTLRYMIVIYCILLVAQPFMVFFAAFQTHFTTILQNEMELQSSAATASASTLEQALMAADEYTGSLLQLKAFENYFNATRKDLPSLILRMKALIQVYPSLYDTARILNESYVYSCNNDTIISQSSGYLHLESFYQHTFRQYGFDYSSWKEQLLSSKESYLFVPEESQKNILYSSSIGYGTRSTGRIFFPLDSEHLTLAFQSLPYIEESFVVLLDSEGRLLYSQSELSPELREKITSIFGNAGLSSGYSDREYVYCVASTAKHGLKVCTGTPIRCIRNAAWRSSLHMLTSQIPLFLLNLLMIAIVFLCSLPHLKATMEIIMPITTIQTLNPFRYIRQATVNLINTSKNYQSLLEESQRELQTAAVSEVIFSKRQDPEVLKARLAQYGICLSAPYYRAAALVLYASDDTASPISVTKEMHAQILSLIQQSVADRLQYLHMNTSEQFFFVALLSQDENRFEVLKTKLAEVCSLISKEMDCSAVMYLGSECDCISRISYSFKEVHKMIAVSAVGGRSLVYDSHDGRRRFIYDYTSEDEHLLQQMLQRGDDDGLLRYLDVIRHKNLKLQQDTLTFESQLLYAHMLHTLLNCGYSGRLDDACRYALHDLPMDEFFTYLKRYYLALSKQIQEDQETETLNEQRRILEYIRQHYMDSTLCLASVADVFGIHERSLQALLRNETQLSFAAYLEKIRLEQSMTLLTGTHLSIAEIALQVGYSNDRSFRRAFKRHYDKTPTELRQPPEGEKPDDPD